MPSPNAAFAHAILSALCRAGVGEFVVCAGSRNSPLAVPLFQAAAKSAGAGGLRVWNAFDERAAAFFAVGRIMASGAPAAVVTTSGTAAAELLPAAVEAHYQGLPLVLVTADRPRRFRGSGAPQAVEQAGLFGPYCAASFDLEAGDDFSLEPRLWDRASPCHLNACFDEPLHAAGDLGWEPPPPPDRAPGLGAVDAALPAAAVSAFAADFSGGAVLLGALAKAERGAVRDFCAALGCPVWAEAASGLREDPVLAEQMLPGGEAALRALAPRKVLRLGGVPSLRFWRDLEDAGAETKVLSVSAAGFSGLARASQCFRCPPGAALAGAAVDPAPRAAFRVDPRWAAALDALLVRYPRSEPAWVRALSEAIPAGARVFLGNSMPIREWNLAACREPRGREVFACRGANGIDGQLSAFFGASEGAAESWAVVGDLTALYDFNAPWMAGQLGSGRRRIAILNNGGGKIFSRLPALCQAAGEEMPRFENRHSHSFEPWASMWDAAYFPLDNLRPLPQPDGGLAVLEIRPDPAETEAFWRDWTSYSPDKLT